MPGGDQRGPAGAGPMTGRRMGQCAGNFTPGRQSGCGRGFGRGFGRGAGRGRGGFAQYDPATSFPQPEVLREQVEILRQQLKSMEQQLAALDEQNN